MTLKLDFTFSSFSYFFIFSLFWTFLVWKFYLLYLKVNKIFDNWSKVRPVKYTVLICLVFLTYFYCLTSRFCLRSSSDRKLLPPYGLIWINIRFKWSIRGEGSVAITPSVTWLTSLDRRFLMLYVIFGDL